MDKGVVNKKVRRKKIANSDNPNDWTYFSQEIFLLLI